MEHVWIASDGGTQVGIRGFLPLVIKLLAIDAAKTHSCHATGDNVEACSNTNDVEVVMSTVFKVDSCFIEADDGVVLDIDDIDIGSVELLEVGILETRSLDTPIVRLFVRRQDVFLLRIVDAFSLLLDPEVVHLLIRFLVEQVVLVISQPVAETSILPKLLEKLLSFLRSVIKGILLRESVEEASEAVFTKMKELRVPLLGYLLLLDSEISLTHWDGQIRSSLEDFEVTRLWAPSLGYLNPCCAGSDDGTFLAVNWDLFVRPERGVMNGTLEFIDARPVRDIPFGSESGTDDKICSFSSSAVGGLDVPTSFIGVELSINNDTLESRLALDVENLIASVEIIS